MPTTESRAAGSDGTLTARLTGERPVPGATPDSLLALHDAGYREVAARLGPGLVLDTGCGLGYESARLAGEGRQLIGVDYDAGAAADASRGFASIGLRTACTDAAALGLRARSVDFVCSSHLVEHFDTPARHVAELARVLRPDGTAFFLTPNAPWDYENPFHIVLFEPEELRSLLAEHFAEVEILGLDGTDKVREDFTLRRAKATKALGYLDPLDIRHRVPRSWWVAVYSRVLPLTYKMLARSDSGGGTGITEGDYFVTSEVSEQTPVLFGIASRPRARR